MNDNIILMMIITITIIHLHLEEIIAHLFAPRDCHFYYCRFSIFYSTWRSSTTNIGIVKSLENCENQ